MRESGVSCGKGLLDKPLHHIPKIVKWRPSISCIAYKRSWRPASSTIWYKCVWAIALSRSDKQIQIVFLKHTRLLKRSKMKKGGGCFSKSLIAQPVMTAAVTLRSSVMILDLKHPRPHLLLNKRLSRLSCIQGVFPKGSCKETETHLLLSKA